ncbi:MAG: hypothetical protein R2883_01100 [Caldisericia bacterium]
MINKLMNELSKKADVNNSLAICLHVYLNNLGKEISIPYISGLLGAAFSPTFVDGEDCTAWWMEGGFDINIDFVMDALGLKFQKPEIMITLDELKNKSGNYQNQRNEIIGHVKDGHKVIMNSWPLWTIITGYNEDKDKFELAQFEGFPVYENYNGALIMKGEKTTLPKDKIFKIALSNGIKIATGETQNGIFSYGGRLYKETVETLKKPNFCEPCAKIGEKADAGCLMRTLARMIGTVREYMGFIMDTEDFHGELNDKLGHTFEINHEMERILLSCLRDQNIMENWNDGKTRDLISDELMMIYDHHRNFSELLSNLEIK